MRRSRSDKHPLSKNGWQAYLTVFSEHIVSLTGSCLNPQDPGYVLRHAETKKGRNPMTVIVTYLFSRGG